MPKSEMDPSRRGPNQAQLDELGDDPGQVGIESAGQSGDMQGLSSIEDSSDESVVELAEEQQSLEAAAVWGVEQAADHPERPVHAHGDFGHPEDGPPKNNT